MGYVKPEDFDAVVAGLLITREKRREIQKMSREELQRWVVNLYKVAFEDGIKEIERRFEIKFVEEAEDELPFAETTIEWEDVMRTIAEVKGIGPKILAKIDKKVKETY